MMLKFEGRLLEYPNFKINYDYESSLKRLKLNCFQRHFSLYDLASLIGIVFGSRSSYFLRFYGSLLNENVWLNLGAVFERKGSFVNIDFFKNPQGFAFNGLNYVGSELSLDYDETFQLELKANFSRVSIAELESAKKGVTEFLTGLEFENLHRLMANMQLFIPDLSESDGKVGVPIAISHEVVTDRTSRFELNPASDLVFGKGFTSAVSIGVKV